MAAASLPTAPPSLTKATGVEAEGLAVWVPVPAGLAESVWSARDFVRGPGGEANLGTDKGEKADMEMVLSSVTEREVTLWLHWVRLGSREGDLSMETAEGTLVLF